MTPSAWFMCGAEDNPAAFPTIASSPHAAAIRSRITTMRAEHSMSADLTRRAIDFFDRSSVTPS